MKWLRRWWPRTRPLKAAGQGRIAPPGDIQDPEILAMSDQEIAEEMKRLAERFKARPRRDLRFVMGPRDPEDERYANLLAERLIRNLNYNVLHDVPTN